MKFIKVFSITALLCSLSGYSQITKGNYLVGGDVYLGNFKASNKDGNEIGSGTTLRLSPNIGYFFFDKFAAGMQIPFTYNKPKNSNSSAGISGSPFVRYYLLKSENTINVLVGSSFGYGQSWSKSSRTEHSQSYSFEAGPAIFFNSSVALEITANYEHSRTSSANYDDIHLAIGFQIHLTK